MGWCIWQWSELPDNIIRISLAYLPREAVLFGVSLGSGIFAKRIICTPGENTWRKNVQNFFARYGSRETDKRPKTRRGAMWKCKNTYDYIGKCFVCAMCRSLLKSTVWGNLRKIPSVKRITGKQKFQIPNTVSVLDVSLFHRLYLFLGFVSVPLRDSCRNFSIAVGFSAIILIPVQLWVFTRGRNLGL